MRVGLHQGLDLGGDIGPLSVQGDELPSQAGQSTTAAASVPATTTVWCSRAETIWPAQVACRLHPCFLSLASILALPARFSSAGVGQAATTSETASCSSQGPSTASRAGWIWVYRPRIRFAVWLTWRARSRSKPVSMLSAAASSSEALTALRV